MKLRLVVMNGQRIVEAEEGAGWKTQKVDKAHDIKPGIYNIYRACLADKSNQYDGIIVHASDKYVYQQVGKNFVIHAGADFDKIPRVGLAKSISYNEHGRTVVAETQNLRVLSQQEV